MQKTREMYIPANAKLIDSQGTDAIVYFYTTNADKPCVLAFQGRAIKPKFHYHYDNEAARQKRADAFIQDRLEKKIRKENQKLENQKHDLKSGDILVSFWGYEQTNIDFYQVVSISGKTTIELRAIERNLLAVTEYMSGTVTAKKDAFSGPSFKVRFSHGGVKVGYSQFARLWTGRAEHYTAYA